MKKFLKCFLIMIVLMFSFTLNVKALTQDEARQKVIDTENEARELVNILTEWSNSYSADFEDIISRSLINKVNSLEVSDAIDLIINELNSKGHGSAAGSLSSRKASIMTRVNNIKSLQAELKAYFQANVSGGVVGSRKVFVQIEDSLGALKSPIKNLIDKYYDSFSNKILAEVDSCTSASDVRSLYDDFFDKLTELDAEVSALKSGFSDWQDLYNQYGLEDYEDYIREEFGDYYRKLDSLYNKVYNKLETKLQNLLDQKIQKIISDTHTETDYSNPDNVLERNNRLWDIINYIEDFKSDVESKISKVNSYVKINTAKNYLRKYEDQITDRIDEAIEYTKTYLIDNLIISVKNDADKAYIKIDMQNGLIIYDSKALEAATFIAKLKASYGTLQPVKLYNGNIGTLSEVQAVYNNAIIKKLLVVVKGDVNPSGRIDITDVVNVCNKMFGKISLSTYQFIAADMNNDSKIDITDIVMICNRMFK